VLPSVRTGSFGTPPTPRGEPIRLRGGLPRAKTPGIGAGEAVEGMSGPDLVSSLPSGRSASRCALSVTPGPVSAREG
jgi:hypothetical protein